jgi:hypothetical protein
MVKSIGESRVRVDFNPSDISTVGLVKKKTAELIDLLQHMRDSEMSENTSNASEIVRLISLSQTAYEEAGMWAVKAITGSTVIKP